MAIGAAIANLEVRFGGGEGLVIRTGWNRSRRHRRLRRSPPPAAAQPIDWKQQAEQLDQRLARYRAGARPRSSRLPSRMPPCQPHERRGNAAAGPRPARPERNEAAAHRRVAFDESTRDFDAQRRIDLAAIDQGMARLQTTSGAEVRQYRDLIQRMYRATVYQQTSNAVGDEVRS